MDLLNKIFFSFIIQLASTVGVMAAFGLIVGLCAKGFYKGLGGARRLALITGAVGTPVHEGAHALACLIFGHKIVEICLFRLSDDGTLGYVKHKYNKRNIYQRCGNFFIGIAPVIAGALVLLLLLRLLCPAAFFGVRDSAGNAFSGFTPFMRSLGGAVKAVFGPSNLTDYRWWIFMLLGCTVALHMNLSRADLKGSLSGLTALIIIVLLINIIVGLISRKALQRLTGAVAAFGGYLTCFMLLALLFSLLLLLIGGIAYLIRQATLRRRL